MANLSGPDVDIEISLKEYGLAWEIKENETIFYYGIAYSGGEYTHFGRTSMENDVDFNKEFGWADLLTVTGSAGHYSLQDWQQIPLISKIQALLEYYSYENVFGNSCTKSQTCEEVIGE